ncbi:MAG: hypothetical protein HYS06_06585 [Methylocystis sp.]|nr:hypothetical protein [Methylocystis sp.]
MLRRYWFQLEELSPPDLLNRGCGITAYDIEDASVILRNIVFSIYKPRDVLAVVEDIDISTLDEGRVRKGIGDPSVYGVWFPLGLNDLV